MTEPTHNTTDETGAEDLSQVEQVDYPDVTEQDNDQPVEEETQDGDS